MATVSKRLRYEVLRRDNFACRYCGASAPDAKLTVDAVIPEALGGTHKDPSNLVAACDACNGGKSATPPDASVVADVAQDALRWSQAMQAAAAEATAKGKQPDPAERQFAELWEMWTYDDEGTRRKFPKDPGWQQSVTALTAAGLTMALLEECIQITMARRKVEPEHRFRYMCGVAWNKVTELQERARQLTQAEENEPDSSDSGPETIPDWCRLVLSQRDAADAKRAADYSRNYAECEEPDSVLWFLINDLESDRASLRETLRDLLLAIPDGTGEKFLQDQETFYRKRQGDKFNPSSAVTSAAQWAAEHLAFLRGQEELAAMPAAERESWIQLARDENADIAEHLDEEFYIAEGARLARTATTAGKGA